MNKEKMSKFLKGLREENVLSQKEVGDKTDVSYKTVSDWENGKTIPNIDQLNTLSNIYKVSIEEILEGSRHQKLRFNEKYRWNVILINSEFKRLLNKKMNEELNLNEEDEFEYLFENYYELREYSSIYINSKNDSNYLKFKESFYNILGKFRNSNENEKLFEIYKLFKPKKDIILNFKILIGNVSKSEQIKKSFNLLESWEKDMYFMLLQKYDLFINDEHEEMYGEYIEDYEDRYGKIFEKEEKVKSAITFMIKNGACYNELFLNKIQRYKENGRVIDAIEDCYKLSKKPLKFNVCEKGKYKSYLIENTCKNRFLLGFYQDRSTYSLNVVEFVFTFDELFEFLWKYDPNDLSEKEEKEIKAELGINSLEDFDSYKNFIEKWKNYRNEEAKIEYSLNKLKVCEDLLNQGIVNSEFYKENYIGGKDFESMINNFYAFKEKVTYKEFENLRDKKKSKELLDNLNNLSLDEINEYFKEKVIERE